MRKSLMKLVDNLYTGKQKIQAKEVIKETRVEGLSDKDNYLLNYKILAIPFQDKMINLSEKEITEFYSMNESDIHLLGQIDFLIANLITTLSRLTNKDVKKGYEDSFVLDKNQPEFDYLVSVVEDYLSSEKGQ